MPISLRLLSVSIACMIPISSLALTLGKVDVQSAIDEPLRATVNVNNIAVPLTQLKAGVATASAYSRLGASRQSLPNLRFLLKDLGQGNAQMWIVSNERISEPFVDLVIHITEGDLITTHPLPLILAAPDSSAQQIQLERRVTTPPVIATAPSASTNSPAANPPSIASSSVSRPTTASTQPPKPATKAKVDLPKAKAASPSKLGDNAQRTDYRVKNRETLSGIASRYARGSNVSLDTAMSGILALNPGAFINNNPNLIKANAQIKLPSYNEATKVASQLSNPVSMQSLASERAQTAPPASISAQVSSETKPSASSKTEQPKAPRTAAASTAQPKPADLKMDIISASPKAPSSDATAQPSEKATRNLPTELGNKISEVRQSTITKRQSVNQLITQLNTYNAKIKLQNSRLAELESKLKSLNKTNK